MGVFSGPLSPVNPLTGKTVSVMAVDCMLAGTTMGAKKVNRGGRSLCWDDHHPPEAVFVGPNLCGNFLRSWLANFFFDY